MISCRWLWLASGAGEPAWNMALDEALMTGVARLNQPVLRLYRWTEPAATFGYSQRIEEIERATPLRPLVRRPTGGGLVPHEADWTYSVALPPKHAWYQLRAEQSYEQMHRWLQQSFARLGVATALAPCCRKEIPGQCFAGYEKADLLWQGRKIAGAAQRRSKQGLLIQGSIQPQPAGIGRAAWEAALGQAAVAAWEVIWAEMPAEDWLLEQARDLARAKYASPAYNRRR